MTEDSTNATESFSEQLSQSVEQYSAEYSLIFGILHLDVQNLHFCFGLCVNQSIYDTAIKMLPIIFSDILL